MSKVMLVHVVEEIESEAGWGTRVEDRYYFPTKALAEEFCKAYSLKYNTDNTTPSWYMYQEYCGTQDVTEEKFNKHCYKGKLVTMPNWKFNGF